MQIKGHFADSDDAAGEAVDAAAAAVPDSAVDSSTLHLQQVGVQFVTAVPVPMDLELKCSEGEVAAVAAAEFEAPAGSIHADLEFDC
mmetsp:Transcript_24649/g.39968  ORF Transcript_24649/g.39968 Transcript_24649/m.39968 type:complete len:87 (+) Transcript_24649:18-278(+)